MQLYPFVKEFTLVIDKYIYGNQDCFNYVHLSSSHDNVILSSS